MYVARHLVLQGKLLEEELAQAVQVLDGKTEGLTDVLVRLGFVSEEDIAEAVASVYNLPLYEEDAFPVGSLPLDIPVSFLRTHVILPLREEGQRLFVAIANPENRLALDALKLATGKTIDLCVGPVTLLLEQIGRLYGSKSAMAYLAESTENKNKGEKETLTQLKESASEAPVIKLVNLLFSRALTSRASDIHIEPFRDRLAVRFRIDGVLREVESPPAYLAAAVISRVKIMAKLNIAERRLPQDGRTQIRIAGKVIDCRVSTVPTMHGESLVIRLLDPASAGADFALLGFDENDRHTITSWIDRPYGIVLVTGPTGSGKTTTLYSALSKLNTSKQKILTVEDPVEYELPGINQIQVKPSIGLTFAHALRSILRQDPDIIFIGEIRDRETAEIAIQSALTGHLVLSTLHTNNAASAPTRLLDMGIEPYLLTSTVIGVLAQRLVRVLCPACKVPMLKADLPPELPDGDFYHAKGCPECAGTGFHQRMVIAECLSFGDDIRRLILHGVDAVSIERAAKTAGMKTMIEDGLQKAALELTSLDEVYRVTRQF